MDHYLVIEELARMKLKEAECLVDCGLYDGAYYMAGYAVELILKARICRLLNVPNFFLFDEPQFREVYRPYRTHDYENLVMLAGLHRELENKTDSDSDFKDHWNVLKEWSGDLRYSSGKTKETTSEFLASVKAFTIWMQNYL